MKWLKTGMIAIVCSGSLALAGQAKAAEKLTVKEMQTVMGEKQKALCNQNGAATCKAGTNMPDLGTCQKRSPLSYKVCAPTQNNNDTCPEHKANTCHVVQWHYTNGGKCGPEGDVTQIQTFNDEEKDVCG